MDAKTSTKATIILCLGTALTILAQVILYKVQEHRRLVIIFGMTGWDLIAVSALGTLLCIGGLLAVFAASRSKDGNPRRFYKAVIIVLGVIVLELPAILYFLITLIDTARGPNDPKKIKSPDGKHFIVRTSDTAEGRPIYCYYVREWGVVYRPIYDDYDKNFEHGLEWTDEGVIYEGKLYEY